MTKMEALFPSGYHQVHDNTSKRQKVKASLANLAWPFKADRAKKLMGDLSNVKATIYLALTVQTTHDVREIKDQARAIRTIVSGKPNIRHQTSPLHAETEVLSQPQMLNATKSISGFRLLTLLPYTIEAIPEEDRLVVQFALKWIFYHQHLYERDISLAILLEAIERSISELTASKHHYFLDEDRLRDVCGCLITVTPKPRHFSKIFCAISFAHFTVWEFVSSMRIVNPHATFFSVRENSTIMELTRVLICEALDIKADKLLGDSDKDIQIGRYEHFDIFCALSSVYSLSFLGREVSEQVDLRSLAFDLLDHSKDHFTSIYTVALAICDPWTMSPEKVDYFLYAFLSIKWPSSSKYTIASPLAELLIVDQTCELAKTFIEQSDEQKLFQTQLEIHKLQLYHAQDEKLSYKFRGSIVELFAQLSGSLPTQFRFLLEIGGTCLDPSMVLFSYLGAFICSHKPPMDALPKILQLVADVNSSRFVVSPLQIATQTCNLDAVLALLEAGANPNYKGNSDGMRWEDGTLLSQFNGLVGLCPLDIYLLLPNRDKLRKWGDKDEDEIRSLFLRED